MLANASHVNHNLVDHKREWLSSALEMVQRLLSSSPIVKGADLAYNQEEGVPNDSSVSKHQRAGNLRSREIIHPTHLLKEGCFFTFMFFRALNTLPACNKLQLVITASLFWVLLLEALIFNVYCTQIRVEDLNCI